MARDIYIKPDDDAALRYAAEQQMAAAKQGGPLEQLLGYASKIPGAMKEEQKARAKRAALSQFMATKGESDVTPETPEETLHLAQAKKALQEPYIPGIGAPEIVEIGGVQYLKNPRVRGGASYQPVPFQKGELGSVKEVADAITTYGAIDTYFDKISDIPWEPMRRLAASGVPGSMFLFPKISQAEKDLTNIYQFSRGGKQLTEPERKSIREIVVSATYGPEQREIARTRFKELVRRGIEAGFESKALGAARPYLQSEFEKAKGPKIEQPKNEVKQQTRILRNKKTRATKTQVMVNGQWVDK